MTRLYGIKNCDTVKKARKWLERNDQPYEFHDFRVAGLDQARLLAWVNDLGAASVINRRSTTWKQLSDDEKSLFDKDPLPAAAIALIVENPTLIKRPVLESDKKRIVGFDEARYTIFFN